MEKVNCDLCGADAPEILFTRKDRFTNQDFQFVTCTNCGLIYLQYRPSQEELDLHYPHDYEAYYLLEEGSEGVNQWHLRRMLNLQLAFVEQYSNNKGRLLDIGAATGNFMKNAHDHGWEVLGIEPIEKAANIAREYYHLEVITGTLETAALESSSFDVACMWDVLEHVPSPRQTLAGCFDLLKPNGLLVFSIPNLKSFDRYLFGENWIGWDAPRHFNMFTEDTLKQLLDTSGFYLAGKKCILGGKGTFKLSIEQVLENKRLRAWFNRAYPLLSALLWPYRQVSYLVDRGPIITYAARKKV
ncbi:MAG: class I SAM-dependent methyltransferase [Chloroflexota bacterium]|nr:MAG: class I SAM-dependent methyltransferase [Chloroflexota bacterium]